MKKFSLKNYTVINKIGFGSFGNVFKIQDKMTGEIFAAKVSTTIIDMNENDEFCKNFEREVTIISKVHHPSIIKFIGLSMTNFKGENKPVIVTDFLPNGSLQNILSKCQENDPPPQWNDTMKLINIYGIAAAMAFLHEHKIIHRDLKPDNILMNQYLFPVLADFGISKDESVESSTINIKGTPIYIAPEIWEDNQYSQKGDVYAFAYILYEIYANQRPFKKITCYKLQKSICQGERPDVSSVPSPYKELIEACWSGDTSERPTFQQIVSFLKNEKSFITKSVVEKDFKSYVKYIDESPQVFDIKTKVFDFNSFNINNTVTIQKVELQKDMLYPADEYSTLTKSCKNIVKQAEEDPNKQYEVGCNLINGDNKFPQNIELGVKYLQESINGGCIEAAILYNRMLISGKMIEPNLEEAETNLKNYNYLHNKDIIFLQAMIEKKKENYLKCFKLLDLSIRKGNGEAMYEYGRMLYLGIGIDANKKEALKLFAKAKLNHCDKSDAFLRKQEIQPTKKPNQKQSKQKKNIDIIFLIDGTKTNKFFIEAIQETFESFSSLCHTKYPSIYFRFGAVVYYDFIFILKARKITIKPHYIDLTDSVDEVSSFLERIKIKGGGNNLANDWAIGYKKILDSVSWNSNAEKVVIHCCNCPAHGKNYTIPIFLHKKYFRIPIFKDKNNFQQNFKMYKDMQDTQKRFLTGCISSLAEDGVKFFCLNGNENTLYCFKRVADAYERAGGKTFVVNDLFGFTSIQSDDSVNNELLDEKFLEFAMNVVDSCANKNKKKSQFEIQCEQKFQADFDDFFNSNNKTYKSAETTETDNEDGDGFEQADVDFTFIDEEKKPRRRNNYYDDEYEDENDGIIVSLFSRHHLQQNRRIDDDEEEEEVDFNKTIHHRGRVTFTNRGSASNMHQQHHHGDDDDDDDGMSRERPNRRGRRGGRQRGSHSSVQNSPGLVNDVGNCARMNQNNRNRPSRGSYSKKPNHY